MYRAILFDIDGVLIRYEKYYSLVLEEMGYKDAPHYLDLYFQNDHLCTTGHLNPLEEIQQYLDALGWEKSAKEFFDEQFLYEEKYLDINLMREIENIRKEGTKCYLATDQNSYRKGYLLNALGFSKAFDGWYISSDIGYRKINREYWDFVINSLKLLHYNLQEKEILFIDDRNANINMAKEFGIACFHIDSEKAVQKLFSILEIEIVKNRTTSLI